MKHLIQKLNMQDDSISYTVEGEHAPAFVVCSQGYLSQKGVRIGAFKLRSNQWHLYLYGDMDGELYMSGPPDGLFKLPEFELDSLTKLINEIA